jgi:uncharacterized membrane protein YeaQ/YmgE (transglycosylase-associated protein family)
MLTWGALCFGLVIGWVTYRTLRRSKTNGVSDIATIIGAVGGAAVTKLFPSSTDLFGTYCIGLAIGFFAYLVLSLVIDNLSVKHTGLLATSKWMGGEGSIKREDDEPR